MDKEAIDLLISKNPRLKSARDKLEAMKAGTHCIHRSWGQGIITEYDAKANRLLIDFNTKDGIHPMDPAFCVNHLEILSDTNILVRSINEPDVIEDMIKNKPTDLIAAILADSTDNSASNMEIENQLSRLIGERKYKKWWTATKKALVKDPRIAVPSKKTGPYVLREIPVKAEDEVLQDFFQTKAPKKKIALASKLLDLSVTHDDIEKALPDILSELTGCLKESRQLNDGERLNGIWVRNDLARFIHSDVDALEPTSASLLKASENLSTLAEEIPGTKYKRFLDLIERTFEENWKNLIFDLLRNSQGKFTTECITYLYEKEFEEEIKETLERWLDEQSLKGPIIIWVIKNRNSRKYGKMLSGLINSRLLSAIFYAIDYEALQNASSRRIPLAELLGEDKELIIDLLSEASVETAHDLAQTLLLNQGFEDLSKKSLIARFIKLFPSIQALVDGSGDKTERKDALMVSTWSFEQLKKDYEELVKVKIPENKEAIATAREHGDLKENSEYKMARQDQDTLLSTKNQLETDIARAQQTDFNDAPTDVVGIGSVVELIQGSTGESVTYSILGAFDSDPEKNILSYLTPLAEKLISSKKDDTVKISVEGHEEEWTVKNIARWVDCQ
jgi:transcription elongation GreA/GreB family factor